MFAKQPKRQSYNQYAPTDDTQGMMATTIQLELSRSRGGGGYGRRQGLGQGYGKGCGQEQGFDEG